MKPKIPTNIILSDECSINIGQVIEDGEIKEPGVPHYVHIGEFVEILPVMSVKEVMQISRLQNSISDTTKLDENLTNLCKELSKRIVSWDWTNLMGDPMEQPYNRPDILEDLSSEELMWLMSATGAGESADARKKDLEPLENTSLEMDTNQTLSPSE